LGDAEPLNGSREDGLFSVLRVSYDSLAKTEQKMILDAAAVFYGEDLSKVQRLWKGCGWQSSWENLLDRCLVTVTNEGRFSNYGIGEIGMHEVLRDLGKSIASPDSDNVTTSTRISDIKTALQLCDALSSHSPQGQVCPT
jgi:hypothetical protein